MQRIPLVDAFDRSFPYLRLSLTDACNFRCQYCLPDGYQCEHQREPLSLTEIQNLLNAFTRLGTVKVRLTGGEPTLRKDFTEIAELVAGQKGIEHVAFTTNGYKLRANASIWQQAGIKQVNVSLDSLNPATFNRLTGHDKCQLVQDGIEEALSLGYETVRVNIVMLKGVNHDSLPAFLEWGKDKPIDIRFIELMQTGDNLTYFQRFHASADPLRQQLLKSGWQPIERRHFDGPAEQYHHPDYQCRTGIIAPYSKDFCSNCNRLRVTAYGDLRLCLFGEEGISLRPLLQREDQLEALIQCIQQQMLFKKSSHELINGNTGLTPHLASVGG